MKKNRMMVWLRKRMNITALVFCAVGIALNLLLSAVAAALGLPLYLDTVGTVSIALLGGYLPGVLVGFVTNVIKTIADPSAIYYGVLNVFLGFVAAFLAERGWHKKVKGLVGMTVVFTLLTGVLGVLISWSIEGLTFDAESLAGMIFSMGLFGRTASYVLANLLRELPDKVITVLLAVSVVRLIPERYHAFFHFTMWMQNASAEGVGRQRTKNDVRVASLRMKALVVLMCSLTLVAIAFTALSASVYRKVIIRNHTKLASGTASIAAEIIDGDRVDEYLEEGSKAAGYRETKEMLEKVLSGSPEIAYLYVYRIEEDGCHVVFDIDTDGAEGEEVGSILPFDAGFSEHIPELLLGERIDPIITRDLYGYLLTSYQPVYDSDGRCVCYAGADVDMNELNAESISFIEEIVSVFAGFFVLLCTFSAWITDYQVIFPINALAVCLDKLSHHTDTQEGMDENVKRIRRLHIHTGDELENLYLSACSMTKNQAEQMRSIRRLSESTARMQDGLIITMADLVESRDSDTGAHVQKTAAYVKIIVEGLKRKGYYPQKITPKFMSDVVRSAPLHDVGKINIPDAILNKPGKLTEEEYEIMKTHTTAGKRIMENAISTVEGDSYLKEARNMAAYHHEKWDGTGYPEGIHGEVIPLSARIMAVADVFDALSSPRVYKPPFSLEDALAVLEEGKGKHFDPRCVEVFMEALPEVKVILRKYNQEA